MELYTFLYYEEGGSKTTPRDKVLIKMCCLVQSLSIPWSKGLVFSLCHGFYWQKPSFGLHCILANHEASANNLKQNSQERVFALGIYFFVQSSLNPDILCEACGDYEFVKELLHLWWLHIDCLSMSFLTRTVCSGHGGLRCCRPDPKKLRPQRCHTLRDSDIRRANYTMCCPTTGPW